MIGRPILHKYANEDVSLGSWFIGLEVEHIDDRNMCCGTPPGTILFKHKFQRWSRKIKGKIYLVFLELTSLKVFDCIIVIYADPIFCTELNSLPPSKLISYFQRICTSFLGKCWLSNTTKVGKRTISHFYSWKGPPLFH